MSYLVYLNNYNIRQFRAQYLWVLYEVLYHKLDAHYILTEEYLRKYTRENSWEVRQAEDKYENFNEIIKEFKKENCSVMKKPEELLNDNSLVPSEILRKTVYEELPTQRETIEKVLKNKNIEAGILWVNNRCFRDTLKEHGLVTFHHELGPFRPSCYVPTVYLDLQGVNGDTEFNKRFEEFLKISDSVPILSREEIIRIISPNNYEKLIKILHNKERDYEIGVGLQVELDTNLLLFNNGVNWIDPMLKAEMDSSDKVLVRPHPAAGYNLKPIYSRVVIDNPTRGSAQTFINKCNKIYCLNSSVGLEAMLLGREAKIFGDSPFTDICDMDEETKLKALNFVVFGYLIHRNFLFDDNYYKFRLSCIGDEKKTYLGNMKRFLEEIKKN